MSVSWNRVVQIASFLKCQPRKPEYDFSAEIPPVADPDLTSNYVGAVVALDYGFWRIEDGNFKADYYMLNGQRVKGATFLWVKSKEMLVSDPSFFTADRLKDLSTDEFARWLKDDSGSPPFKDNATRLRLIRNYGHVLKRIGGSLHRVYLRDPSLKNILITMERFDAYRDYPLFKKAHLLCKIMQRVKQWAVVESPAYPKIPPIDYHLMNMAWKLGIVDVSSDVEAKFKTYSPLSRKEELAFRCSCAKAYHVISKRSGMDAYDLDDVMWMESRRNCQVPPYNCDACLFKDICERDRVGFPVVDTYRY